LAEGDDRAEQAKQLKVELYAERAEAGLPLFDESSAGRLPGSQSMSARVRAFQLGSTQGWG
jgi:hypothetical protein